MNYAVCNLDNIRICTRGSARTLIQHLSVLISPCFMLPPRLSLSAEMETVHYSSSDHSMTSKQTTSFWSAIIFVSLHQSESLQTRTNRNATKSSGRHGLWPSKVDAINPVMIATNTRWQAGPIYCYIWESWVLGLVPIVIKIDLIVYRDPLKCPSFIRNNICTVKLFHNKINATITVCISLM